MLSSLKSTHDVDVSSHKFQVIGIRTSTIAAEMISVHSTWGFSLKNMMRQEVTFRPILANLTVAIGANITRPSPATIRSTGINLLPKALLKRAGGAWRLICHRIALFPPPPIMHLAPAASMAELKTALNSTCNARQMTLPKIVTMAPALVMHSAQSARDHTALAVFNGTKGDSLDLHRGVDSFGVMRTAFTAARPPSILPDSRAF